MSFLKKLLAVGSTVAMMAAGFVPTAALAAAHSAGSVVKTSDGTVWFITEDNTRRAFTSGGAMLSYGFLSYAQVVDANSDDLALTAGEFIAPRDGSIFCATATKGTDVAGECSLITGGMKAAFTSAAVFTGQGFSFANADYGDSSFLSKTTNIDSASAAHRQGVLVNNGGTVQLVGASSLMGIPSTEVFNSWGYSFADVVTANAADTAMTQSGVMCARMAGQLNPSMTAGSCGDDEEENNGDLEGGAGDITVTALSTYGDEEVGEGEEEVPVLAFEVEADDDSDVEITSVKVELAQQTGADSEDLTDYASEVSVWMDGDMVGAADAEDFTENNDDYTKSISLDGAVIRAGETMEFALAVSALDNLDSGDIDSDDWQIGVSSVRFIDGDGVTTTEAFTLDIDDNAVDDTLEEEFDFASFATAANVELKVALADSEEADDVNDAHVIDIDDSSDTDDVEVLVFTIEADGDSDLNIQEIPATITTTGETAEAVLVSNAQLWMDGEVIANDTVPSDPGAVVFEDLDVDIEAGEEVEFTITVDIQDTNGAADNGDTVKAELTTANVDAIEAEDEVGEEVADADASGSAVGEAHAVYDEGIMVEFVSADAERTFTADASGEDDQGTYTIVFDITAFDGDMYIDDDCEDDNGADAAGQGTVFDVNSSAGTPTGGATCLVDAAGTETGDTSSSWQVQEGETRQFTFTVTLTADTTPTDGNHQVILESINWDDEAGGVDSTPDFFYNFNMDDFETDYLFLNGIA